MRPLILFCIAASILLFGPTSQAADSPQTATVDCQGASHVVTGPCDLVAQDAPFVAIAQPTETSEPFTCVTLASFRAQVVLLRDFDGVSPTSTSTTLAATGPYRDLVSTPYSGAGATEAVPRKLC